MKMKSILLWLTCMPLGLNYIHGARPNDCMPRSTFMSRGDLNGWRLKGFVFHYYKKISLGDCAEECLRRTNCKSLNYNVITMYCELNTESYTAMPENISSDSEFYHSLKYTWETGNLLLGFTLPKCDVNQKVSEKDQVTCILAECNDPPERRFAQHTSTLREVNSVVYYSCLSQYGSLGDVTSTCEPDGSWKTSSFECLRNCSHPPVVNHGTAELLWSLETQFLSYECDANYEAVGNSVVYCQANGSWTEINFLCLRICENPPLVSNSSPNVSRTLEGRSVSYTCHVNYIGFGNTEILCQPNGTWSISSYVCVRECKNPPVVSNSTPSVVIALHGNSTVYSCNMNYAPWPSGARTEAMCDSDGRWIFLDSFSCKRECINPPPLTFGKANESSALDGMSVSYMCTTGYISFDAITSTCKADGDWTEPSSYCRRGCINPPPLTFGTPNESFSLDGMSVSYMCTTGYKSVDAITSTCKADGNWTELSSSCLKECLNPPPLTFGTPNESSALDGMSVSYTCTTGYKSVDAITSTCKADGNWTDLSSSCLKECLNPPPLTFGTPNESSALDGMTVSYTCTTGYKSVDAITSTCKVDGNWTELSSSCLKECLNPPPLTFGTPNESSALDGMSVSYTCTTGYKSVDAITSTCKADGNWTELSSSCLKECADPPSSLRNATTTATSAIAGQDILYLCNDGLTSVNVTKLMCLENGDWSEASFICE